MQLHSVVLEPGERAPQVPEDTARMPLEMWVKGWLLADADLGQAAQAKPAPEGLCQAP